jgi:hypothetical protein
MKTQRALWEKLRDSLKDVHTKGSELETLYGPTPTRVPIQWLVVNDVTQKSPVDDIPVLLLQVYNEFNQEQKLWADYLGGEDGNESSIETDSESEATEQKIPSKVAEFLSVASSAYRARDICVALVTAECSNDVNNSYIKSETEFGQESEQEALKRFDELDDHLGTVRSSVQTALCLRGEQRLPTCHPQ